MDVSPAGNMLVSSTAVLTRDGKRLFVTNSGTKNLMVINTENNSVEKVLPIKPRYAIAMGLSADGRKLFVPSEDASLYIVDTVDLSYRQFFAKGASFGPVVPSSSNPDLLYAVGTYVVPPGHTAQPAFFTVNITDGTVERSVILDLPQTAQVRRLIISPDESRAYFGWCDHSADKGTGNLDIINLKSFSIISSEPVENGVVDFTVNEETEKAYILGFWTGGTAPGSSFIMEWDISNNSLVHKINVDPSGDQRAIAFDPSNANYLYMTEGDPVNILRKVEISSGKEVATIKFNKVDVQPYAIIRDSNTGYVVSLNTSKVIYKLDLTSGQLIGRLEMPYEHLAGWGFYQGKMYVSNGGDIIYAIDPSDGSIIKTYQTGTPLRTIKFTVFGDRIAALDFENAMIARRLVVFDARTMKLLNSIDLPPDSYGDKVTASPDGSKLYVLHGPSSLSMMPTTVIVLDSTTLKTLNTILITPTRSPTDGVAGAEADFDEVNRVLYIVGHASVYEIGMDNDKLIGTLDLVDVYGGPQYIRWSPTGLTGIVLCPTRDKLFIVSCDAHSVFTYDLAKSAWSPDVINLKGYFITDAVASPDKRYIFTANGRTDSVTQFDTTSGQIVRIIGLQK